MIDIALWITHVKRLAFRPPYRTMLHREGKSMANVEELAAARSETK
jgi:hypothetical protein